MNASAKSCMGPEPSTATASEWQQVTATLAHWMAYEPGIKCDVSSCAWRTLAPPPEGGPALPELIIFDPVPLADAAWTTLLRFGTPRAIVLTNENHLRAGITLGTRFNIPLVATPTLLEHLGADPVKEIDVQPCAPGEEFLGIRPLPIRGASHGETAWLTPDGVLIFGDALVNINGEPALLPSKYCVNARQNRESLKHLLQEDLKFDIVCFAHGLPIAKNARERLLAALEG